MSKDQTYELKGTHLKLILEFCNFEGTKTGHTVKNILGKVNVASQMAGVGCEELIDIILKDKKVPEDVILKLKRAGVPMPALLLELPQPQRPAAAMPSSSVNASLTLKSGSALAS